MSFYFFDLDGTLADTDGDIRLAWKAAIADLGLSCPRFDRDFIAGPPIDEMTRTLFPDIFTPALADSIRRGFAAHYDSDGFPTTREYPGVMDRIHAIKANGARVYIVTNKRWAGASAMWKHFSWGDLFDGLYTGDMYAARGEGPKLRKPELLKRIMAELDAAPADSVMIGDTISDFEAAKANSVRSIGVIWGYGSPADLALADSLASTPSDLR